MRTLALTLILTLLATQAQAVTYQRTATLSDGSSYIYEVTFDISALDDAVVLDSEATSSLSITDGAIEDSFYTDTEMNFEVIFFANGTGLGVDPTGWLIQGEDTNTYENIFIIDDDTIDSRDPMEYGYQPIRYDHQRTSAWHFKPDEIAVPEPLTASLLSLAAAPLLLRRRRDA